MLNSASIILSLHQLIGLQIQPTLDQFVVPMKSSTIMLQIRPLMLAVLLAPRTSSGLLLQLRSAGMLKVSTLQVKTALTLTVSTPQKILDY